MKEDKVDLETDLSFLVNKRKYIRIEATKVHNSINSDIGSFDRTHCLTAIAKLKRLLQELSEIDNEVSKVMWAMKRTESEQETEYVTCDSYKDKINMSLVLLEEKVLQDSKTEPVSNVSSSEKPHLRGLQVPLPVFKGEENEELDRFLKNFESAVGRFSYSSYEKFLLLKEQVKGKPATLLSSLEITSQTYEEAKKLLMLALASPMTQKFNAIKKLTNLKLTYESEPFQFISQFKNVCESFDNLQITVEDIKQYFIWSGLNDTFRTQLMLITGQTKPTLENIDKHFFDAAERFSDIVRKQKKGSKVKSKTEDFEVLMPDEKLNELSNLAIDIKTNTKSKKANQPISRNQTLGKSSNVTSNVCKLCKDSKFDAKHMLYKCKNYPDPSSKIERLNQLKACVKCANVGHNSKNCSFKFKNPCFICQGAHFGFLCPQKKTDSPHGTVNRSQSSVEMKLDSPQPQKGGPVCFELYNLTSKMCGESILPTFTSNLGNGNIRILVDSGSQGSFITERAILNHNFTVYPEKVELCVSGVNTTKRYETQHVDVPIKMGQNIITIKTLCIPKFEMNSKIPDLGRVFEKISEKGYTLADKNITANSDRISEIDLIIGVDYFHHLELVMTTFGNAPPSCYYNSANGVILIGNSEEILKNASLLPMHQDAMVATGTSLNSQERADDSAEIVFKESNHFCPFDLEGNIDISEIERATEEILKYHYHKYIDYDKQLLTTCEDTENTEQDDTQIQYVLDNAVFLHKENRIEMPLIWNSRVAHLLGSNQNLARQILFSTFKKYSNKEGYLEMIDESFKEQEKAGIIERIPNLAEFLSENPSHSFLAHMPVFRLNRESTKCRVVLLSNLCERDRSRPKTISHNQAMLAGPCLNQKLTTTLLSLRFDKYIFTYDIKKAFSQIALNEFDQNKLLFFWFANIQKKDFSITAFKSKRLPFGLRCSPAILMAALYKILILDTTTDSPSLLKLKKTLYDLFYMDNGAYTSNSLAEITWALNKVEDIFSPYSFELQQFNSNVSSIYGTTENCTAKLFGLDWDKETDCLSAKKLYLNQHANTKRLILQTIAANFDPFNIMGPMLNRARLFMHELQCDKGLNWDETIHLNRQKEWTLICNQVNNSPVVSINRFVGEREGNYRLIACTDASKSLLGVVIYIQNIDSDQVSFVIAKNRMVNKQLESKSIPALELHAILLGVECLTDLYKELTGSTRLIPIKVIELELYTDSLVGINWISSHSNKLEKMNKKSTFVVNRLNKILDLCEISPVKFRHIAGHENPADYITRAISYKTLCKSNYLTGPSFLRRRSKNSPEFLEEIVVPDQPCIVAAAIDKTDSDDFYVYEYCLTKFSLLDRMLAVLEKIGTFILKLKSKLVKKNPAKYAHWHKDIQKEKGPPNYMITMVKWDQSRYFPDIKESLQRGNANVKKNVPSLIHKWNLCLDKGVIRVKSKFGRGPSSQTPFLLSKESTLTRLIIQRIHLQLAHAGYYSVIAEMKKFFWLSPYFQLVKKVIKECVHCRRFNNHAIKLNQAPYKEFRSDPPAVPFRSIFVDYCGPFKVKLHEEDAQVWILVITCLWSRAINLKICRDMSRETFCRAFQLHCFEYGLPEICRSDLGSQIVAGGKVIQDFLRDAETRKYLAQFKVMSGVRFEQFDKGHSELGSLVESCVKMTKRLLWGAIKNVKLDFFDFEFFVMKTVHLVNRRPIAFKETLRDDNQAAPDPITPENLLKGYDLPSVNVIPGLQGDPISEEDWTSDKQVNIEDEYFKLRKVQERLKEIYHTEFLAYLTSQATNLEGRYAPVYHQKIECGDIVLIQEPFLKPTNYPMAVITEVTENVLGEIVGVKAYKGKTKESVRRHASSIIPLLRKVEYKKQREMSDTELSDDCLEAETASRKKMPRRAANKARQQIRELAEDNRI